VETSRSFFNFSPNGTVPSFQGPIDLPNVNQAGVFNFNDSVQSGVPVLLDPAIAVGYVFKTGTGDPLFQSVALPTLGNSAYEIDIWNGNSWVFAANVAALSRYYFSGPGVAEFRVLGIDPALMVSPSDGTAFLSSVTFAGDGSFTGSMTPIAMVPEPETMETFSLGLLALLTFKRRQCQPRRRRFS
jgi:hypothetical protein